MKTIIAILVSYLLIVHSAFPGLHVNRFLNIRGGRKTVDTEYYDILGINSNASEKDIKKAYREKAMKLHPDRGGDTEQFKKLAEAYEVLSHPEKKSLYDQYGKNMTPESDFGHSSFSTSDFANSFFRGFGRTFSGFSIPIIFRLDVTLEDLYMGKKLMVPIQNDTIELMIEKGMMSGIELIVRGYNNQNRDIIFRINELPHNIYKRNNNDLLLDLKITLSEALFGFKRNITHLNQTIVYFQSPKDTIISHDAVFCLDNMGMPIYKNPSKFGKLYIRTKIEMPKKLTTHDKEVLYRFKQMYSTCTNEIIYDNDTNKPIEILKANELKKLYRNHTTTATTTTTTSPITITASVINTTKLSHHHHHHSNDPTHPHTHTLDNSSKHEQQNEATLSTSSSNSNSEPNHHDKPESKSTATSSSFTSYLFNRKKSKKDVHTEESTSSSSSHTGTSSSAGSSTEHVEGSSEDKHKEDKKESKDTKESKRKKETSKKDKSYNHTSHSDSHSTDNINSNSSSTSSSSSPAAAAATAATATATATHYYHTLKPSDLRAFGSIGNSQYYNSDREGGGGRGFNPFGSTYSSNSDYGGGDEYEDDSDIYDNIPRSFQRFFF